MQQPGHPGQPNERNMLGVVALVTVIAIATLLGVAIAAMIVSNKADGWRGTTITQVGVTSQGTHH